MSSESFHLSAIKQVFLAILLFQLPFLKNANSVMAANSACDRPQGLLRPSRLFDQHFGLGLDTEDLLEPFFFPRWLRSYAGYLRPWRTEASQSDLGSSVNFDKDQFVANLDVQQFTPEEISVKLTGENTITIEGKHEEKQDEHGYISRHFVRKYVLPENTDMNQIQSKLSSDGVLTITAPRIGEKQIEHKNIPIQRTGEPARKIQQQTEQAEELVEVEDEETKTEL